MVDYRLPPLRPGGLSTSPSTYSHSRPYSHERDHRGSTASADLDSAASATSPPPPLPPKSETGAARPMSAVLAALANEDVEYTGIVRPLRDGTYDRSDRYLPPLDRLDRLDRLAASASASSASAVAGPSSSRRSDYGPLTTHGWEESYRSVQTSDLRRGSDAGEVKPRLPYENGSSSGHGISSSSDARTGTGTGHGSGSGSGAPDALREASGSSSSRDHGGGHGGGSSSKSSKKNGSVKHESKERPAPTSPEDATLTKKKKRKVNPAKPMEHIPEGAEVEYEQDGDPLRGPVFVHPPKDAVQACVRCHRIKRKCDGARPRCSACTKADVPCVFELSPATST